MINLSLLNVPQDVFDQAAKNMPWSHIKAWHEMVVSSKFYISFISINLYFCQRITDSCKATSCSPQHNREVKISWQQRLQERKRQWNLAVVFVTFLYTKRLRFQNGNMNVKATWQNAMNKIVTQNNASQICKNIKFRPLCSLIYFLHFELFSVIFSMEEIYNNNENESKWGRQHTIISFSLS